MPQVPKEISRKPALLIDCFGTISNRHYIWYAMQVWAYKFGLRKELLVIAPEVVPVLHKLKKHYVLVFFSNSYHPWMYAGIKAQGLDDLFDHVVISSEVRARKPRAKIYRYALTKLGYQPEECILVDNAARNNRTAEKLGIKTMPFTSQADLYEQLRKLLPVSEAKLVE
jgi:HAD superfamily hydrolase (TIGR01509 family)